MASIAEIEKELLRLTPSEGAHIAMAAWESLAQDAEAAADPGLEPAWDRVGPGKG